MTRLLVAAVAALALAAPAASASPTTTWYWNHYKAEHVLYVQGLSVEGVRYDVERASCYGLGRYIWGDKGLMFQRFRCSVLLYDDAGTEYDPYGLVLVVDGKYAWHWRSA